MASEPGGPSTGNSEPIPEEWKLSEIEKRVMFSTEVVHNGTPNDDTVSDINHELVTSQIRLAEKYLSQFWPAGDIPNDWYVFQEERDKGIEENSQDQTYLSLLKLPAGAYYYGPKIGASETSPVSQQLDRTLENYYRADQDEHPYSRAVEYAKAAVERGEASEDELAYVLAIFEADNDESWSSGHHGGGKSFEYFMWQNIEKYGLETAGPISLEDFRTYQDEFWHSTVIE